MHEPEPADYGVFEQLQVGQTFIERTSRTRLTFALPGNE